MRLFTILSTIAGTLMILAVTGFMASLTGCSDKAEPILPVTPVTFDTLADRGARNTERICFIGVDALTWDILTPMIKRGELPHLKKLAERGSSGPFDPADDRLLSPRIWTTMATGKAADKHGITFFLIDPYRARNAGKTAGSDLRNCLAIWNILSHFDKSVQISNYMVTWPAESVNGTIISDYFYMKNGTFPDDLQPDLASAYFSKDQRQPHDKQLIEQFFPWYSGQDTTPNFTRSEQTKLDNMLPAIRRDEITLKKSLEMIARQPPDLSMLYLRSVDLMSHFYWKYSQLDPQDQRLTGLDLQLERYGDVVPATYRWADAWIGRIVATFPEDTTFILVSDHGFMTNFSDFRTFNLMKLMKEIEVGYYPVGKTMLPVFSDTADPIDSVRRIYMLNERIPAFTKETGISADRIIPEIREGLLALKTLSGKPLLTEVDSDKVTLFNKEEPPELAVRFNADLKRDDRLVVNDKDVSIETYLTFLDQSGNHESSAVIIMAGPHIPRGKTIENARALDITPTLLALFDMPVADDMDGKPLVQAFTPDTWTLHPLTSIDTYEGKIDRDIQEIPEKKRPQILQELKAIGYIQ